MREKLEYRSREVTRKFKRKHLSPPRSCAVRVSTVQSRYNFELSHDLQIDLEHRSCALPDYHLLLALLKSPSRQPTLSNFSALHWHNAANEESLDRDRALLNLAVAFEALLRLANSSKAEHLKDAIALLLGRTERLDEWADQFYAARLRVAHEGPVQDPYFYIPTHRQTKQKRWGSLAH